MSQFLTLYKYRQWDKDSGPDAVQHRILTVPEIFFAPPSTFNDPWDCNLDYGLEGKTNEEVITCLRQKYPAKEQDIRWAAQALKTDRATYLQSVNEKNRRDIEATSGVCCFAATATNSLAWGHYARGSRGFCVSIDCAALGCCLKPIADQRQCVLFSLPVEYCDALPVLDPHIEVDEQLVSQYYRYKAGDWRYEQEYRFVLRGVEALSPSRRTFPLPAKCITGVILGFRIAPEHEAAIRQEVRKLDLSRDGGRIEIKRAVKSQTDFAFDIIDA